MPRGKRLAPSLKSNEAASKSTTISYGVVQRAKVIPAYSAGNTNAAVARALGGSISTANKWHTRFLDNGLQGFRDDPERMTTKKWLK